MKTLLIIRGVSGSGKTTLANRLTIYNSCADYFFDAYHNGEWKASLLHKAHEYCYNTIRDYMINNKQLIAVHNTFTREKEIKPYIDLAKEYGYQYFSIIVENVNETESVHSVPEETLTSQENRFVVKLRNKYKNLENK